MILSASLANRYYLADISLRSEPSGQDRKGNVDLRLVSRSDPSHLRIESDKEDLPDFPVSAYDEVPARILPPSPGAFTDRIRPALQGNLQESAEKMRLLARSFRIRWPEPSSWDPFYSSLTFLYLFNRLRSYSIHFLAIETDPLAILNSYSYLIYSIAI